MSSLTKLLLALIFPILANLLAAVNGQINCGTGRNYTSGSTYESNRNSLLQSLSTNVDEYGFYNASVGQSSDRVYGFIMCRGDLQLDYCRSNCVPNATVGLAQWCPYGTQAAYWSDVCTLRYSDEPLFGNLEVYIGLTVWTIGNASSPDQFNADLTSLLQDQFDQVAANGTSLLKVAAGSRHTADFRSIYAMVQCTPDLTAGDCNTCLTTGARSRPLFSPAARIQLASCFIRYDEQPFYNNSRLLELAQLPLTPPPVRAPPVTPSPVRAPPVAPPPVPGYLSSRDLNLDSLLRHFERRVRTEHTKAASYL